MTTANKSLLLKNVRHLVTCDTQDRVLENVNVYIEGGWIRYIGQEQRAARKVIDASGMTVYPGLVNTHHHLFQVLTRNLPHVQNLELFDWLIALYEIWKNMDAEALYHSNMAGMAELLKSGCTTVFDHHYLFPRGAGMNLIDAQFAAAETLGVRMVSSRGSMSMSKKDGGLPPDSVVQTDDEILKDCQRVVERFHDASPGAMRQVVLAPCAPFNVSETLMRESAAMARSMGVRLHTHLCETKDEEVYVMEKKGMRPLAYMESLGWVGADVWYAHGIHFNSDELKQLAATQTGVAHCPVSNMKLSSGVCRVPEMLEMGVPVGLAVDGSASNDASNLLADMRAAYLLHRLTSAEKAPSGYDILKIATRGGAKVLGRSDIGYLAEGMAADLFAICNDRLELAGAGLDPKSVLATVGVCGGADLTVVHGEVLVQGGRLTGLCEQTLARNVNEAA
ncbi:MAG: 8-oxoguanine deaminase, partial [Defluviitaleaceae bacterium]|nr:8-oxoguanine deaminase [Defluviitaleaceae bacterium]